MPGTSVTQPYQYEETKMYGLPEYQQALSDWQKMYGTFGTMFSGITPKIGEMMNYYTPGGGYGQGLRQEAKETVGGGVARDLGSMVESGMSSSFGARGTQTRATSELAKMYKNIEDTRNQLWMQAVQPYTQMAGALQSIQASRPTYKEYITPITERKTGFKTFY